MTYSPTHAELVVRASQWLRNNKCSVVITELSAGFEIPDAIGKETSCRCKKGCYVPSFEPKYNQKCQPAYKWADGTWRTEKEF